MKRKVYEEYSKDKKRRLIIFDSEKYFSVIIEQYQEQSDIQGYLAPAGFYEVNDVVAHNVGTIEEGISIGRELMKNS